MDNLDLSDMSEMLFKGVKRAVISNWACYEQGTACRVKPPPVPEVRVLGVFVGGCGCGCARPFACMCVGVGWKVGVGGCGVGGGVGGGWVGGWVGVNVKVIWGG